MLAEPEEALWAMAKKTAIISTTVTTVATKGHCRRSQPPCIERRRSAAARAAALRCRAAAIRSLWLCAATLTFFDAAPLAPLAANDFTAGRAAVAVAPFDPFPLLAAFALFTGR
jgi:hypothetical protein